MRVVARRTLRKGAFSLRVPASTVAARYALRIQVAGRKRWSWVTTPGPAPAAPVPAAAPAPAVATATPTPTPTIEPWSICGGHPDRPYSAFDAEVRLSATEATAGETLAYTLVNTGQYEVFDGGSHRLLPADHGYPDERGLQRAVRLDAGKSAAYEVTIPADTPAGRYRIWHELQINATCDVVSQRNTPSEPFDVLAPGEPEPTPTATPAER